MDPLDDVPMRAMKIQTKRDRSERVFMHLPALWLLAGASATLLMIAGLLSQWNRRGGHRQPQSPACLPRSEPVPGFTRNVPSRHDEFYLRDYEALRASCKWAYDSDIAALYFAKNEDFRERSFNTRASDRRQVKRKVCTVHTSETTGWSFDRIGPFTGTGGYDWHVVREWHDVGKLSKTAMKGVEYFSTSITKYFMGSVLADGTALGHPPVMILQRTFVD